MKTTKPNIIKRSIVHMNEFSERVMLRLGIGLILSIAVTVVNLLLFGTSGYAFMWCVGFIGFLYLSATIWWAIAPDPELKRIEEFYAKNQVAPEEPSIKSKPIIKMDHIEYKTILDAVEVFEFIQKHSGWVESTINVGPNAGLIKIRRFPFYIVLDYSKNPHELFVHVQPGETLAFDKDKEVFVTYNTKELLDV